MTMVRVALVWMLLFGSSSVLPVDSLYANYEDAVNYHVGDRIQLMANKLTSPTALAAMDYQYLPLSNEPNTVAVSSSSSSWNQAVSALHGDAFHSIRAVQLTVGQDVYCATACQLDFSSNNAESTGISKKWHDAVMRDFGYNFWLDGLPASYRTENEVTITTRYWGGVPVGRMGGPVPDDSRYNSTSNETVYLYNHVNIQVEYRKQQDNKSYQILRTVMEPYSVQQYSATDGSVIMASCDSSQQLHTKYEMLSTVPVQPATGKVRFTYDVQWIESTEGSFSKRWNVFLNMDGAVPPYIEVMGCFLGGFFLVVLTGVLYTWVRRDLSYKPVVDQIVEDGCTEEETTEIQMWPLSTRIFFPPTNAPVLLCIACGTGAQLLVAGFLIVVFFRVGIISQAQGAKLLTPCIILYAFCSVVGGYVTARLCAIFHGELKVALASCLVTAIAYPLMGMLVSFLAYDVFPDSETPSYRVMANSTPLVLLWIFFVWPVTVGGGYLGYRGGAIQNFPVSEGSTGYQDLNLQDDSENKGEQERKRGKWASCHKRYRIAILLAIGGLLPVLSCFVSYSYGVVGPIFLGFYSLRSYTIASYLLFVLVSGAVAVLLYYRQIRAHVYEWWWAAFAAAGSAGIYIFLLSMSYMLFRSESHVSGNTKALYLFWFAYISFGVTLATGFTGVAVCMWFNRAMYTYIMNSH